MLLLFKYYFSNWRDFFKEFEKWKNGKFEVTSSPRFEINIIFKKIEDQKTKTLLPYSGTAIILLCIVYNYKRILHKD
jgi:hypothetical protein